MATTEVSQGLVSPLTVEISVIETPAGYQINCYPNPLSVDGVNNKYAVLNFLLVTDGYEFVETGAIIVTETNTQFALPSFTERSTLVKLFNYNLDVGSYHYRVGLKNIKPDRIIYIPAQGPVIKNGAQ